MNRGIEDKSVYGKLEWIWNGSTSCEATCYRYLREITSYIQEFRRVSVIAGACPDRRIIVRSRFVHRQTISVLLHQSGQPTHPRLCLPLSPAQEYGSLRRNKFAFQPTSLVLGRTAAGVHVRWERSRRKLPSDLPNSSDTSRSGSGYFLINN
jgi:hypothetical protein